MASRTPEWIKESFKTFRPGPIAETATPGTWLSVRTNTPGLHTFTDRRYSPEPLPGHGDGMYVQLEGAGVVTFTLNEPVTNLYFGIWSPNGSRGTTHARYFGVSGGTLGEVDHPIEQTGQIAIFTGPGMIAGVDISRNDSSPHHVCVDNFSTVEEDQLESLKALAKKNPTMDDILNLGRKR